MVRRVLSAKLVVYHDELDPSEVSVRLALEPTDAFRRGQPIVTKRRRYSDHPTGGWILSSRDLVSQIELEAHVTWLLDRIEPAAEALRSLRSEGRDVALIFVVSGEEIGGGPTLEAKTIARIAKLELPIDLDVYC